MASIWTRCLCLSSKLKVVEDQLQLLGSGKSMALQYLENVQDTEDVNGLFEDLQDILNDYMVCAQSGL